MVSVPVEPNCIRLERDLPASEDLPARRSMRRRGRVCEGMEAEVTGRLGENETVRMGRLGDGEMV